MTLLSRSCLIGILCLIASVEARKCREISDEEVEGQFEKMEMGNKKTWKQLEGVGYGKIPKETRKALVHKSKQDLNKKNKEKNRSFCLEINELSSLSDPELDAFLGGKDDRYRNSSIPDNLQRFSFSQLSTTDRRYYLNRYAPPDDRRKKRDTLPSYVDWTENMGPVENQHGCACCWAFAASHGFSAIESVLKGIPPKDYSEQELIDCVYARDGCIGGYAEDAWNYWLYKEPQIGCVHHYKASYGGSCVISENGASGIIGWQWCGYKGDEEGMKEIVSRHPVVVAWYANRDFYSYSYGVYDTDEECGAYGRTNHAMVVAGYGTDWEHGDYWLLKNSWGPNWGMNGYVKVKRGKNLCNIASYCMYPTIDV